MDRANRFLQSCDSEGFDARICKNNNYYSVTDQQVRTPGGGCEGCYYAVRKSEDNGGFHYRIVGQTYTCSRSEDTAHGYFAVRTGRDNQKFLNLDTKTGEPVFPSFGCIDIMGVLINIDSITTSGQAKRIAVK